MKIFYKKFVDFIDEIQRTGMAHHSYGGRPRELTLPSGDKIVIEKAMLGSLNKEESILSYGNKNDLIAWVRLAEPAVIRLWNSASHESVSVPLPKAPPAVSYWSEGMQFQREEDQFYITIHGGIVGENVKLAEKIKVKIPGGQEVLTDMISFDDRGFITNIRVAERTKIRLSLFSSLYVDRGANIQFGAFGAKVPLSYVADFSLKNGAKVKKANYVTININANNRVVVTEAHYRVE